MDLEKRKKLRRFLIGNLTSVIFDLEEADYTEEVRVDIMKLSEAGLWEPYVKVVLPDISETATPETNEKKSSN